MWPSQAMEHACERTQEVAEKRSEAMSKRLKEGLGKAECWGQKLKKKLSRVSRKTERNKVSKNRRKGKGDTQ